MSPKLEVRLSDTIEAEVPEQVSVDVSVVPSVTIDAEVPDLVVVKMEIS